MIITIWDAKLFVSFVFRFIHSFEEKLNSNLKLIVKVLSKSLSFEERERLQTNLGAGLTF